MRHQKKGSNRRFEIEGGKKGSNQEMKVLHNLGNPVQSCKLALAETESPYNNALTEGDIMASLYKTAEMAY